MSVKLLKGDCVIESKIIESGKVDLILTDPPFGNMKGADLDGWGGIKTDWDKPIEPKTLFDISNRILRKNGKLILFSQEPYTTKLITEAIPNIPFLYRMIWKKDHFANALLAKKAPVNYYEDILVFAKKNPVHDNEFTHPLRNYFKTLFEHIGKTKSEIISIIGQRADHTFRFNSPQFLVPTQETYNDILKAFSLENVGGVLSFQDIQMIDAPYRSFLNQKTNSVNPAVFNLWQGGKYKGNILEYKKDYTGLHPTQKPVLLLEDLIKTFSNEKDLVTDLTMGSGSTGEACIKTNRDFIGIELGEEMFNVAENRINNCLNKPVVKNISQPTLF